MAVSQPILKRNTICESENSTASICMKILKNLSKKKIYKFLGQNHDGTPLEKFQKMGHKIYFQVLIKSQNSKIGKV